MTPAELLIPRLDKARQTGPGRWSARCPAHEDKSPSLSVRELDDGRLLVHCFGGCEVGDIVGALDLTLGQLFPDPLPDGVLGKAERRVWALRDVLPVIDFEAHLVAVAVSDVAAGRALSYCDAARVHEAANRINQALRAVGAVR